MTLKELIDASSGRRPERSTEPDALDYLHGCLDQLAQLSLVLASHSPIHAKPIHLDPEDIIGGDSDITGTVMATLCLVQREVHSKCNSIFAAAIQESGKYQFALADDWTFTESATTAHALSKLAPNHWNIALNFNPS